MVHQVLGALCCLALVSGCAMMQLQMREPGEKIVTFPGPVAEEYKCNKRKLPFFRIEGDELVPDRVKPGSKVNYRYTYVLCPSTLSEVVSGTLYTRVHYKGKSVFTDAVKRDLQPGRWVVDSFVTIPPAAEPGMYALEAEFRSRKGRFRVHSDFLVVSE